MEKSHFFMISLEILTRKKKRSIGIKNNYKLCILCQQKLLRKCLPRVFYSLRVQMHILAGHLVTEHNPDGI